MKSYSNDLPNAKEVTQALQRELKELRTHIDSQHEVLLNGASILHVGVSDILNQLDGYGTLTAEDNSKIEEFMYSQRNWNRALVAAVCLLTSVNAVALIVSICLF